MSSTAGAQWMTVSSSPGRRNGPSPRFGRSRRTCEQVDRGHVGIVDPPRGASVAGWYSVEVVAEPGFSRSGAGVYYYEFVDDVPTRQVSVCGEQWLSSDQEHSEGLTDRYYSELYFTEADRITLEEFERVWAEAVLRQQSSVVPRVVRG